METEASFGPDLDALVFTSEKGWPIRHSSFRREVWNPALKTAKVSKGRLRVLRVSARIRLLTSLAFGLRDPNALIGAMLRLA